MSNKQYDFSDFDEPKKQQGYDFSDFDAPVEQKDANDTGILATLIGQGLEGGTFGLSDRLEGAAGAALRAAGLSNTGGNIQDIEFATPTLNPEELKKAYYDVRDKARARDERQEAANPMLSTTAELAGGFLTPGLGIANMAGKGIKAAATTGAKIGALGGAAQAVSDTKEIEDLKAMDLVKSTAMGAGLGGVLGGASGMGALKGATALAGGAGGAYGYSQGEDTQDSLMKALLYGGGAAGATFLGGKTLGGATNYVANSKLGQDLSKIYTKAKQGVTLSGPEQAKAFNAGLMDESGKIVDNVMEQVQKLEGEYAAKANTLKVGKPEQAQKQIDELMESIVEREIQGGKGDPRAFDAKIEKLRKSRALNEEEIASIYDDLAKAKEQTKTFKDNVKYNKMNQSARQVEQKAELDLDVVALQREKLELQIQKRSASKADKADIQEQIDTIDRALNTQKGRKIGQNKNISVSNKEQDIYNKAQSEVLGNTSNQQVRLRELQNQNADLNRDIASTVMEKQGSVNQGVDRLLTELTALKKSVPQASYQGIKDANLGSIDSAATTIGREDLSGKIRDIIKQNTPGAQEVDDLIKKKYTDLANLGMSSTDNTAKNIKKTDDVINNLVDSFKAAAKNETSSSANKLNAAEKAFGNKQVSDSMAKARELAENYKLNQKIDESSLSSLAYRGADVAGKGVNKAGKIAESAGKGIDVVLKAVEKLPQGSRIRAKLEEISQLPAEAQQRSIFTLSQQPWFRELTKDENK